MERPPARSARAYLRSRPIVALAAPGHRHVSSTVRLKHACSGCLTKIILHSDASKSILTCASGVRSVRAKVLMGRFSMVVHGTRSRWCRPMTGKPYTGSHYRMHRLHHPHKKPSTDYTDFYIYLCNLWIAFAVREACSFTRVEASVADA